MLITIIKNLFTLIALVKGQCWLRYEYCLVSRYLDKTNLSVLLHGFDIARASRKSYTCPNDFIHQQTGTADLSGSQSCVKISKVLLLLTDFLSAENVCPYATLHSSALPYARLLHDALLIWPTARNCQNGLLLLWRASNMERRRRTVKFEWKTTWKRTRRTRTVKSVCKDIGRISKK